MARKKGSGDISKKEYLSPRECGEISGVFQTTVIYWIKQKGLRAHRSPGGHYKVSRQDLLKFLDAHDIYNVDRTQKEKYKILIIDDEETTLSILNQLFKSEYEVITTANPNNILEKVKETQPDLILLDINMPGKDGFDVLNEIKSDLQTRGIPVIFISGLSDEETVARGLSTTAEDYIRKPFLLEEVRLKVKKIIRRTYQIKTDK